MGDKKPFEIARETLKQLTTQKLPPTPANYLAIYNEIAGIPVLQPFPGDVLRDIAKALPTKTPGQQKQKGLLEYAIDRMNWDGVKTALVAYGGFAPQTDGAESPVPGTPKIGTALAASGLTTEFLGLLGRMIEHTQPALQGDDDRFDALSRNLVLALRQSAHDVLSIKSLVASYSDRVSFVAEDQAEVKQALLKLLRLVFENIAELSPDEQWLKGQMEALMGVATPPLTLRRLDDMERQLRDVIFKQKEAKAKAQQAQAEMRAMLASFIDRLSDMARSTGTFHEKLEENARQIEQAKNLEEIAPLLKEVVNATRSMAEKSAQSSEELLAMREHASQTEAQLARLHQELDRVSAQARHDPLTGALNRKGLDEAIERELSTLRRKEAPLCMALLDIDNFKKLNDTLGHAAGDDALAHLAGVARECMRPQDTLARYGGEEFVILLPDTELASGVEAMVRLQRELTKRFFLAGAEKVLITFSAGVAQVEKDEPGAQVLRRADQAMYLAKRSGKNRVLAA